MRMDGKERYEFIIKEDSEKKLVFLGSKGDPSEMNWVEGSRKWGTVNCPDTLKVEVKRSLLKNGRLQECYRFTNVTKFPVFLKKADNAVTITALNGTRTREVMTGVILSCIRFFL